jgi:hypothetical protein
MNVVRKPELSMKESITFETVKAFPGHDFELLRSCSLLLTLCIEGRAHPPA